MKAFRVRFGFVLLVVFGIACAQFALAQDYSEQDQAGTDQTEPAVSNYTYKAINVPGATYTQAFAINNAGEIVGTYGTSEQGQNGYVDVKGKFTTDNCVLYNGTLMSDINNKDEIVGTYATNDGGAFVGFTWEGDGSCNPINDPDGGGSTNVWGVNDNGVLAGFYTDSAGNYQGFRDDAGVFTTISCSGWSGTRAYGISNSGVIIGDNENSSGGPYSGFTYKDDKCTAVNYPKATSTSAKSMNKSGQISGWYTSAGVTHGFVKTGSAFHSLTYPEAIATLAFHMNDAGQVAGWYEDSGGGIHGFVATPKK